MSTEYEKPSESEVQGAIDAIREKGDFIDADRSLRHPIGYLAITATTVLPAAVVGMSGGSPGYAFGMGAIANMLYVPALIGGTFVGRKILNRRSAQAGLERQDTVQAGLDDEPVDIIALPKKGGLALRWYGMDANEEAPSDILIARARRVGDFAKEHGIEKIVVSARNFNETDEDSRLPGYWAISKLKGKRQRYAQLVDHAADHDVIVTETENFIKMVEELHVPKEMTLADAIVRALNDPHVTGHYLTYQNHPDNKHAKAQLARAVRTSLEREAGSVESTAIKQADGSIHRVKAASTAIAMHGDRLMQLTDVPATPGSASRQEAAIGKLSSRYGYKNAHELITALNTGGVTGKPRLELLSALHILLAQPEIPEATAVSAASMNDGARQASLGSFMERWCAYDESTEHVHASPNRRIFIQGATALAGLALGYMAGADAMKAADDAYKRESLRYAEWAETHLLGEDDSKGYYYAGDEHYDEFIKSNPGLSSQIDRKLYGILYGTMDVSSDISFAMLNALVENVDDKTLEEIVNSIPYFSQAQDSAWKESSALKIPPSMETLNDKESFIGDSSTESNKTVYTATALKPDETTEGYWYGHLYGSVEVNKGSSPFTQAGVTLFESGGAPEDLSLPSDPETIEALDPDFKVETPYIALERFDSIDHWDGVSMPILQGTRVVGARIVDKATGEFTKLVVRREQSTGLYAAMPQSYEQHVTNSRYKEPTLEYWLKRDAAMDDTVHYSKPMEAYTVRGIRPFKKEDVAEIASTVRAALGLPDDATLSEITQEIASQKLYSFTPFEREGKTHIPITDDEPAKELAQIGTILAKLESMNCNIASMTTILATLDNSHVQQATGFHDDGDGELRQVESHAWLIDENNDIVDPTPYTMAPGERVPGPDKDDESKDPLIPIDLQQGAEILVATALAYMAWRRRKSIQKVSDVVRTHVTLGPPTMQRAIDGVLRERYGRAGSDPMAAARVPEVAITPQSYSFSVPSRPSSLQRGTITDKARRTVIRLNDAAIRRQAERKTENK